MKSNLRHLLFLLIGISFFTCEKDDSEIILDQANNYQEERDSILDSWHSMMVTTAQETIQDLQGIWRIDSIEIEFQDSYANAQAGITSDTIIIDFGEINFGAWEQLHVGYPDSTSFKNIGEIKYENQAYPIGFNYIIHSPEDGKIFSFMDKVIIQGNTNWDTAVGWYLNNLGIQDNIEIIKKNQNEYYFVGLNRGIKKMKLERM